MFESNPELANAVYEALGFKSNLKTSLGKELEYKDPYVTTSRLKDFKQYQVLDEKGNDIGSVVIEYRGKDTVILHPKLNITGKGYGKDLYKLISSKLNVEIQEWSESGISKSDSAKAMWNSLEKEGSAKRIVDEEQGDNFRVLKYDNQITSEQKQQAQALYSQYLDTIFPDSKVKDIVYHGGSKTFEQFIIDSENRASGTSQIKKGVYFSKSKKVAKDYVQSKEGITNTALLIILDKIEKSLGLINYEVFGSKEEGFTYEEEEYEKPSVIIKKLENLYGKLTKDNLYYFSEEGLSDYSYMNQLIDFKNLNVDSLIDAMRNDDISSIREIINNYSENNKDTSKLYSVVVNLKTPTIISNKETTSMYNALIGKESLINKAESVIVENVDDSVKGNMREPSDTIIVFEPEQIHILGSKQDIEGFKNWVNNRNNQVQYQLPQGREQEEFVASEKTIRDLAARMSDRIGIPVKYISDRSQKFKGKLENGTAVVNLAYTTLDSPIHEILGHPIIRAIKNRSSYYKVGETAEFHGYGKPERVTITKIFDDTLEVEFKDSEGNIQRADLFELSKTQNTLLYQNLLKELEYGKGKEVFDRIKRDYVFKETLGGEYLKGNYYYNFKDGLYSKSEALPFGGETFPITKEEYEENAPKYTLEEQQEEAIVELLGLMTAEKLDAVKDGKLISLLKSLLKEMKVFMKQLLRQKEVEIDKLPDNMTLGDIADLLAYSNSKLILPGNEVIYTTPDNQTFKTYAEASKHISDLAKSVEDVHLDNIKIDFNLVGKTRNGSGKVVKDYKFTKGDREIGIEYPDYYTVTYTDNTVETLSDTDLYFAFGISPQNLNIKDFIEKNKEYEQSKEIIEEWKKVNNIQYNPEEVYSRGQEFVSVVGAYSYFDINLMMQNLLQHIEDSQKAGGEFTISAFTKPIDKQIGHLEGSGGKIKFKIYPQSQDIKWAANTDVYSGSVWDASEKVNKDKKSELLGVSYTKYPSLQNINKIQPNLASIIDDLAYHHNELGISLTGSNFRLEYDENVPYSIKKIINSINSILDQKYGKLVKPEISKLGKNDYRYTVEWNDIQNPNEKFHFKTEKEAIDYATKLNTENGNTKTEKDIEDYGGYVVRFTTHKQGIQPTQTNETLKESIESVKNKIQSEFKDSYFNEYYKDGYRYVYLTEYDKYSKQKDGELIDITKEEYKRNKPKKEYTEQALINTKIAKLKEVAKKYPRSLIRSEVKPINKSSNLGFVEDELPFQKLKSTRNITSETTQIDNKKLQLSLQMLGLNNLKKNFKIGGQL